MVTGSLAVGLPIIEHAKESLIIMKK